MSSHFLTLSDTIPAAPSRVVQPTLFPIALEQVLDELGLRFLDAERLCSAGLLGFQPHVGQCLHPPEEAELRFLGSLLAAGCDLPLVRALLEPLDPGYAHSELLYDFENQRWVKPEPVPASQVFDAALSDLDTLSTAQLARLSTRAIGLLADRANSIEQNEEE